MSIDAASPAGLAPTLRALYLVRFGFAVVWAVLVFLTATEIGPVSGTLLVLYPLFDVAAIVVDSRTSHGGASLALYANIAVSTLAVAGLAFAVTSGIPAVLQVWGAWAVVSGVAQLAVGVVRRSLGGQWPMILSGGISTLAGTSFVLQAGAEGATLSNLAGYAAIGGVFFLVSALRLRRSAG
ncbi:hypothetical protein SAMN04488074_116112 [Lentzea albidocapillata subsp. violacea]|uniref:Integral membrane protein n=1 Tax=Lentzea albidocapillata subsp. violacea TaxID=128104 RepID=A0A1G9QD48_9PSEU|nr:hypothetical protein [Lentzea albidocapillata]SDM08906.1 hypothetical protein SAMN04488074_116112 [Lentzea albidocapillata subsp. violacea]